LVARILKEKYYLIGDFLHAQLSQRPSYAWRSIIKARAMLEEGRVGNGENVRIWGEKWLLSTSSNLVRSPVRKLDLDAKVSALINQAIGWWNFNLIHAIFEPAEADNVCAMGLSPLKHPNKLVWNGSKNGLFSVKSDYHQEISRRPRR